MSMLSILYSKISHPKNKKKWTIYSVFRGHVVCVCACHHVVLHLRDNKSLLLDALHCMRERKNTGLRNKNWIHHNAKCTHSQLFKCNIMVSCGFFCWMYCVYHRFSNNSSTSNSYVCKCRVVVLQIIVWKQATEQIETFFFSFDTQKATHTNLLYTARQYE